MGEYRSIMNVLDLDLLDMIPRLPAWISAQTWQSPEDGAFLSGAALSALYMALSRPEVPPHLLRARLALRAAEVSVGLIGRPETASDLRDEVHLARPGDQLGPGGTVFRQWLAAVGQPIGRGLAPLFPEPLRDMLPARRQSGRGSPVAVAAETLQRALALCPREEASALILADAALARGLGWDHVLPLLSTGMTSRLLRREGDDLRDACHRLVITSAGDTIDLARDLARRAARLAAVAPKLRAKTAQSAVEMFLTRDALSPSVALTGIMSDRAARRICDRLVDLGAVREMTGRPTFRLYGL